MVPLAWVLRSNAVAIAYLLGIAVWTVGEAVERTSWSSSAEVTDVRTWFPLLLAGILPLWPGPDLRGRPGTGGRFVLAVSTLVGLLAVAASASLRPGGGDVSLLTKGFAFIASGTGFLVFNAVISRRRAAAGGAPA